MCLTQDRRLPHGTRRDLCRHYRPDVQVVKRTAPPVGARRTACYSAPVADPAARPDAVAARAERGEMARYAADYLAARAPLRPGLLAGAIAALGVYAFPILLIAVSFALPRLIYAVVLPVSALLFRLLRPGAGGPPVAPAPAPAPTATLDLAAPTPGVEGTMGADAAAGAGLWPVLLVAFWPLALLAIGVLVALVYRWRRARHRDELERHPVDIGILPEVLLFYLLTAAAALLVRLDSFVALGANAVFAWAGYLLWRWLYDRLLPRFVPAALRADAAARVAAERDLQRRLREAG